MLVTVFFRTFLRFRLNRKIFILSRIVIKQYKRRIPCGIAGLI